MELRIFTEPQQGASYDQILAMALAAEEGGFGAFFRSDHYLKMGAVSGLPGPTDAWITLAGLARDTKRIRLGTLLTAATFRYPGSLAIAVAEVDAMSGGRVELGLGAGWFDDEHTAYGIPFPSVGERFEKLEEQLNIITGLWETEVGSTYSFAGKHYNLSESPALPKPLQSPRPPIIIGGHGRKITPRLAATFADEFNVPFASYEVTKSQFALVDEACSAMGRDPASMVRSAALVVCCGRDESELTRRAANIGRDVSELAENGLAGTPEQVAEKIRAWSALGISRLYLQMLDIDDLEHVGLIASEVLPAVK
ncbi:MAG TPA: LLM class F420-dependent oxidoreductase [Acidimicrobiales bacterium]|jgi:alkanesulfonate monooxygenase|nr:LLM class F420-dependent oxidoreductase [Acidimicrobiales bacterium]